MSANLKYDFVCITCGKAGKGHQPNQKFCNLTCKRGDPRICRSEHKFSKGTTGAISEIKVCADLLLKGYEVFRSVSPNCSCDLMIKKGERILRVEVKSWTFLKGKRATNRPRGENAKKYDVFAVCYPDKIEYESLPI